MNFQMVRTPFVPNEEQRRTFWNTLHALIRGMADDDELAHIGFWRRVVDAPAGAVLSWASKFDRNPRFHRKFFKLLDHGFDAWEPDRPRKKRTFLGQPIAKDKEAFRKDVIIAAGFYTVRYGLDGSVVREAKSISFANMDDADFERLYSAVVDVLLENVLRNYTRADVDRVVDELMAFA